MGALRAVVVDDSASMRRATVDELRTIVECTVVGEGADGLEALQLARMFRPDLIVLDLHMPRMSGLEALLHIKAELPATQVVLVSTLLEPEVKAEGIQRGAVACLEKGPAFWDGLRTVVLSLSQSPSSQTSKEAEAEHGR